MTDAEDCSWVRRCRPCKNAGGKVFVGNLSSLKRRLVPPTRYTARCHHFIFANLPEQFRQICRNETTTTRSVSSQRRQSPFKENHSFSCHWPPGRQEFGHQHVAANVPTPLCVGCCLSWFWELVLYWLMTTGIVSVQNNYSKPSLTTADVQRSGSICRWMPVLDNKTE